MTRLKKIVRSYLFDWPPLAWGALRHWPPAILAKAAIVVPATGVIFLAGLSAAVLLILLVISFLLCVIAMLLMAILAGWSRESKTVFLPRDAPVLPKIEVDLVRLLGPYNSHPSLRRYDAVFEGGGVKAIAQIGALKCFEKLGLRPRKIAGTSGGAVVGALLAAGAGWADMWRILGQLDLTEFLDPPWLPNRRLLRRAAYGAMPLIPSLILRKAIVRGERFRELMTDHLRTVSGLDHDPTFRELEETTDRELTIVATDITRRQALILPRDIVHYDGWGGLDPKDMCVSLAVRMSMAIPFAFEPVRLKLREGEATADIIDGAVSSNYPIWLFDSHSSAGPRYPTFGFLLDETKGKPLAAYKSVRWLLPYAFNVIQAGVGAIDRILDEHNSERTIRIPTYDIGAADFDLTELKQRQLFEGGYKAAQERLAVFDWAEYITNYRGGRARVPEEVHEYSAGGDFEAIPMAAPPPSARGGPDGTTVVDDVCYSV
jgi:NTE family protein